MVRAGLLVSISPGSSGEGAVAADLTTRVQASLMSSLHPRLLCVLNAIVLGLDGGATSNSTSLCAGGNVFRKAIRRQAGLSRCGERAGDLARGAVQVELGAHPENHPYKAQDSMTEHNMHQRNRTCQLRMQRARDRHRSQSAVASTRHRHCTRRGRCCWTRRSCGCRRLELMC